MSGFHDAAQFPFTAALERAFDAIRSELVALGGGAFVESPDSLTTIERGYDETGWLYCALTGDAAEVSDALTRCPATAAALAAVPGLVNAGFSLFRPGTRLYPHRGERSGVLRCHLPLLVPLGDVGLRIGETTHAWRVGRCVVFDDTLEHEAWNLGKSDRVVLIVTFEAR